MSKQDTAVKPALTPEEWATVGDPEWEPNSKEGTLVGVGIAYTSGYLPTGRLYNPFSPCTLIALLNAALPDDDPHKITWEDVDLLTLAIDSHIERLVARDLPPASDYERTQARWRDLRDRIAALLPPREGT